MGKPQRRIVLASRNKDKLRELRQLCFDLPFEVVSALDYDGLPEVIEDGTTLLGNASRKAIVTAAYTGEIAVGDDTALQISALNDWPDIFSSRFAGPDATYDDNAALALELMENVPDDLRQARFVTAAAWVDPRPSHRIDPDWPAPPQSFRRWLYNPFARAIHIRQSEQEPEFWNALADRRRVWAEYRSSRGTVHVTHGTDKARLVAIMERLMQPFLAGGRPTDAPPAAIQLPDSRIWTTSPPRQPVAVGETAEEVTALSGDEAVSPGTADFWDDPTTELPTVVTPTGLPQDAPGHDLNETVWLEVSCEGRLLGEITRQPAGRNGFGYDPIFRVAGDERTLAEYPAEEKNAISHRARALRRLLAAVRDAYRLSA
jgi:non-canonical purine NTP pyrophosphatase (RdgB/HAM1 family)